MSVAPRTDSRGRIRRAIAASWGLFRQTAIEWWNDDTFQLSAALAFYTLFSLAPLTVIAVATAGAVFGTAYEQ